jgi:glycosyltransferase involved in cell wall biosynthesis
MVPTEALAADLQKYGFRRLRVVARGVDTERFDPAHRSQALRQSWGCGERTRVVLSVGRLAPEKNLDLLFQAYDAMRRIEPDLKLVMVGDGPLMRDFRASRPDAIFAGAQRGAALAEHYASADLFLFPSLTETFGNVTPEAMASGLAVLAYDYAAAGQLIRHQESGLLAPLGQPTRFCDLAVQLIAEPQRARDMGAHARTIAESMSWDRIVEQVEATYLQSMQTYPFSPGS